jgi:2'-5' RNA ligase
VRARGVSLWLRLDLVLEARVSRLIRELAERLGTPVFEPHVTLLGGLTGSSDEILERAGRLAAETPAFSIRLGALGGQDEYFRCLYLEVEKTPELLDLHRRALGSFEARETGPFFPHVSLVYGDLSRAEKDRLEATLETPKRACRSVALEARLTDGEVASWRRLARFPFAG